MAADTDQCAKVLFISDEPATAASWEFTLVQAGLDVELIDIKMDVLEAFEKALPDLIIIEDCNDKAEELSACSHLRAISAVPILYFTVKSHENFMISAYHAGADEVISYPITPRLFRCKVEAWLRRTRDFPLASLDVVRAGEFLLDPKQKRLALPNHKVVKLTLLETRLLFLLMNHPGRLIEPVEIIEKVWGHSDFIDRRLLKNHIYRLRRKIEDDPAEPKYLVNVGYSGYKFHVPTVAAV